MSSHAVRLTRLRMTTLLALTALLSLGGLTGHATAQMSLDTPAPRSATNAAIHYQRAILFLSAIDPAERELLLKPIWEIVTPQTTPEELKAIDQMLIASRHATRSALVGASQSNADFGLDVGQYTVAAFVPHAQPMTDLGRLVALHGLKHQSNGEWREAAQNYFYCMRMGRHLNRQPTLTEALAGVDVLETSYFALGNWAVRCPEEALVEEAFTIVNGASIDMVNPARNLRFEATISKQRLTAFGEAFPDGHWAEMVLEALGGDFPEGGPDEIKQAAIKAAVARGVPRDAFESKEAFSDRISKLRETYVHLAKEAAGCLTLPAPESIRHGEAVFAKYESKLPETERLSSLNPARLAAYFAVHRAELDVLRLVLAVSAEKTSEGYPASLDAVKSRFGHQLPTSPYDGSAYQYELLKDGKGFSVSTPKVTIGGEELPGVRFQYAE